MGRTLSFTCLLILTSDPNLNKDTKTSVSGRDHRD